MNRDTLIGAAVLLVVAVAVIWYTSERANSPAPAGGATTTTAWSVPANAPYTENAAYFDIAANYPTTTPLTGSANDAALTLMRGFVSASITQFKTDGQFDNLTPEDITMRGFDKGRKNSLQINYLFGSSEHTVSYIYTTYTDTGGAHGNILFKTFVFDKTTGARLTLADLFTADSNYLDALSSLARARLPQIIGQYADVVAIKDGTTPEEKNFENFFFDAADFVILFPPYQVGAYAAGPQTLRVPASLLHTIMKTTYP